MISEHFAHQSSEFKQLLSEAGNIHSRIGIAIHRRFQQSRGRIEHCLNHYQQAVKFLSWHSRHVFHSLDGASSVTHPMEVSILRRYVCSLRIQYVRISSEMKPGKKSHDLVPNSVQKLHYFDNVLPYQQAAFDENPTYESTRSSSLLFFTLFNMATIYYQTLGDPFMACTILEKAISHAPNLSYSILIHNNLACLWSEFYGKHEESIFALENTLTMTQELERNAHAVDGDRETTFGFIRRIKIHALLNLSRVHYLMLMLDDAAEFYRQYTLVDGMDSSLGGNRMKVADVNDDYVDEYLGAAAA